MMSPMATVDFSVHPTRLDKDASYYSDLTNQWPTESFEIPLIDVRADLINGAPIAEQLEGQGFAVLKSQSNTIGSLSDSESWNAAYIAESVEVLKKALACSQVLVWNSVCRTSDPREQSPYGTGSLVQSKAVAGLQSPGVIRPTAKGAHVDQDSSNSRRICRVAAGEDVFEKYKRVQQINLWRPLRGPVMSACLTVSDGRTVDPSCCSVMDGYFGKRVMVHHGEGQKWCYISRQMPDEIVLIKIYDSQVLEGQSEYCPHTGCQVHGDDSDSTEPRQSIEVRLVALYEH